MFAHCLKVDPLVMHGTAEWYFESGQIKRKGVYYNGKPNGVFKEFYKNGKQRSRIIYRHGKEKYADYWSEEGVPQLVKGQGVIRYRPDSASDLSVMQVKDSIATLVYEVEYASGDTVYLIADEPFSYAGGMEALHRQFAKERKYPPTAVRQQIQGQVFIEFVVRKSGKVTNIRVVKGIGGGCDEEAFRAFHYLREWIPAKIAGNPVNQRAVIPVVFRVGP